MRQVLVAVDDSPASERVSDFVNSFFGGLDVSIVGINVGAAALPWGPYPAAPGLLYGWPYGPGPLPVQDPAAVEAGADSVHAAGEATLEASGLQAGEHVVEPGADVADTLRRVASEREIDVIVVGSGHKGLLDRLFAPSVSAELAKSAPCPVLVVQ